MLHNKMPCFDAACILSGVGGMCMRGSSMTLPSSLQLWPPTVTAAVWKALEDRAALIEKGSSRIVSEATTRVNIPPAVSVCGNGVVSRFTMNLL